MSMKNIRGGDLLSGKADRYVDTSSTAINFKDVNGNIVLSLFYRFETKQFVASHFNGTSWQEYVIYTFTN